MPFDAGFGWTNIDKGCSGRMGCHEFRTYACCKMGRIRVYNYNNTPVIRNQESAERLNDWGTYRIVSVKDGVITLEVKYFNYQDKRFTETVKLTPVTDVNENGYYHASFTANTDTLVTFTYLNIAGNLSVQIGNKAVGEDTILRVAEGEGTKFVLMMAKA